MGNEQDEFQPGDVVRLRSGGPPMSVERMSSEYDETPDGYAFCVWFDKTGILQEGWFASEVLARPSEATRGAEPDDPAFLNWIADRLVKVHGDPEEVDFIRKLRGRAWKAAGGT